MDAEFPKNLSLATPPPKQLTDKHDFAGTLGGKLCCRSHSWGMDVGLDLNNDVPWRETVFGVESRDPWTPEEKKEFEEHASVSAESLHLISPKSSSGSFDQHRYHHSIPGAGHRFNYLWNFAQYLLFTAMSLLLWFHDYLR